MDAIALAQSIDASKDHGGQVSLEKLERRLAQQGHDDLARAVRSVAGYVNAGRLYIEQTAPWF